MTIVTTVVIGIKNKDKLRDMLLRKNEIIIRNKLIDPRFTIESTAFEKDNNST
jgi:hypothetical protein